MFCRQCGHESPPGSTFCPSCGARVERPTVDETTAAYPAVGDEDTGAADEHAAMAAMLVVQRGPNAGSRYLLDQELVRLGRHPEADILLDDVTVSRQHAEIRRTPEGYVVTDAGSLNGTYLNRKRVEEALLRNADELQVGRFRLVFYEGTDQTHGSA